MTLDEIRDRLRTALKSSAIEGMNEVYLVRLYGKPGWKDIDVCAARGIITEEKEKLRRAIKNL